MIIQAEDQGLQNLATLVEQQVGVVYSTCNELVTDHELSYDFISSSSSAYHVGTYHQ